MALLLFLLAARSRRAPRLARRAAVALGLLAAADIAGCALAGSSPPPRAAHVTDIADGDTITIEDDGRRERLRLLGIDSPELGGPHAPGECGAVAALANLRRLADPGGRSTRVRLRADPASGDVRDRYGRLLAYADGPRGDLGEAQLRAGLARVHRHRGRRFSRLARYQRAEADARRHRLGIWTACDPPASTADR